MDSEVVDTSREEVKDVEVEVPEGGHASVKARIPIETHE